MRAWSKSLQALARSEADYLVEKHGEKAVEVARRAARIDWIFLKVPQAMDGDDKHPPVAEPNVADLEAVRAVAFMLRQALVDSGNT
jgi:hypothetical protein